MTGLYLSLDSTKDPGDPALGSFSVPKLKKGKSSALRAAVRIPSPTAPGPYFLIACADVSRAVKETNEHANCRASGSKVAIAAPTSLDADGDGTPDASDCAPTNPSIHPGAADPPDLAFVDSNCDGIDGNPAAALFVSAAGGHDPAAGTRADPLNTVAAGVRDAAPQGKNVYVAAGTYNEGSGVVLAANVSIYGGYDPATWSRSGAGPTTIVGSPQGVLADSVTGVKLQLLSIHATADIGGTAYGVRAVNGSALVLEGDQIVAGAGTDGPAGSAGSAGPGGGTGGNGSTTVFGTAGTSPAGATGGHGGAPVIGSNDGHPGEPGIKVTGGGNFGAGGGAAIGYGRCGIAGTNGNSAPDNAVAGGTGSPGANGAAGSSIGPATVGPTWHGNSGGAGEAGHAGGGGGGGGSGSGDSTFSPPASCTNQTSGGGGGGGGGGAGGEGGGGGGVGGSSFGVYLWNSSATIDGGSISSGEGGDGGPGAAGGGGGSGGTGGSYGSPSGGTAGNGAPGKKGGDGGGGGAGGGGPGGWSVGVLKAGTTSLLTLLDSPAVTPGPPGAGGTSTGSAGPIGIGAGVYP